MILDRLANWPKYFTSDPWREAFTAIQTQAASLPDGDHPVRGDDIILKLGTAPTFAPEEREYEAHREYIDIQVLVQGRERMRWAPLEGLRVSMPHDAARDLAFFHAEGAPPAEMEIGGDLFVVFFPEDAHMANLHPGSGPMPVRKAVIKLRCALVRPPA